MGWWITDRCQDGGGVVEGAGEFPLPSGVMRRSSENHELHDAVVFVFNVVAVDDHIFHLCTKIRTQTQTETEDRKRMRIASELFGDGGGWGWSGERIIINGSD